MSITRKPLNKAKENKELDVNSIINRGGTVAKESSLSQSNKDGPLLKKILIRLNEETLNEMDSLIKKRKIKVKRLQWIEEAVQEKIEREMTE